MLVIVNVSDLDLAQAVGGVVAVHLAQHTDFQAPVRRDAQVLQHVYLHGELAGQGVAIAVQVVEVRVRAGDLFHGANQGRDQQPADPAIQLAAGGAGVEALAELVVEARVGDRVEQPRGQGPVIGGDVAIVQGDRLRPAVRLHVAKAVPDIAAFAELHGRDVAGLQLLLDLSEPRPVVPEHHMVLGQHTEVLDGMPVFGFRGSVQTDHDLADVACLRQVRHNFLQRRLRQLRVQAGQHEGHGPISPQLHQLRFQILQGARFQVVQGGDDTVLKEVTHDSVAFKRSSTAASQPAVPARSAQMMGLLPISR